MMSARRQHAIAVAGFTKVSFQAADPRPH